MIADKIGSFGCLPIRHKIYDAIINILIHQMNSSVFCRIDEDTYNTVSRTVCGIKYLIEDSITDRIS